MTGPLATADAIRRHVALKCSAHELRDEVADRLLTLLDAAGPDPDYASLLRSATFPDPPPIVWHTAPASARHSIKHDGLHPSSPGTSAHWQPRAGTPCANGFLSDQPTAVYVSAAPDLHGLWSHWTSWDVWEVTLGDLSWRHDEVNPGCWAITEPVPADHVKLLYRKVHPRMTHAGHVSAAQLSTPMRDALHYLLTGEGWRPAHRTIAALERRGLVHSICDPHLTSKGATVCKYLWPNKDL